MYITVLSARLFSSLSGSEQMTTTIEKPHREGCLQRLTNSVSRIWEPYYVVLSNNQISIYDSKEQKEDGASPESQFCMRDIAIFVGEDVKDDNSKICYFSCQYKHKQRKVTFTYGCHDVELRNS